jgi:outer membrane protein assembly factor BamB
MIRNLIDGKPHKMLSLRFPAFALAALLAGALTACAGGTANQSWAGLAVKGDMAYLAHNMFVSAVHLDSGQMAWQYPEEGDRATLFYSDPLIDSGGDLVVGAYNGSVVKLDSATGTLKWKTEGDGEKIIAPIAEGPDGAYYVSSESGDLFVLDPDTGSERSRIKLGATSWGPMAVNGTRIYVATIEHKVFAVNCETAAVDWTVDLGASVAGGINLVDGKLVVGTFADTVVALDPQTGGKLWESKTDGWVWHAPAENGGTLFATDLGGVLHAWTTTVIRSEESPMATT